VAPARSAVMASANRPAAPSPSPRPESAAPISVCARPYATGSESVVITSSPDFSAAIACNL
jgi:hypothetical protein